MGVLKSKLINELKRALIIPFGNIDEVSHIQESFKGYQKLKYLLGSPHLKLIFVDRLLQELGHITLIAIVKNVEVFGF